MLHFPRTLGGEAVQVESSDDRKGIRVAGTPADRTGARGYPRTVGVGRGLTAVTLATGSQCYEAKKRADAAHGISVTQYICHRMTPSSRSCNERGTLRRAFVAALAAGASLACADRATARAPTAEFIVAAGDSTYWVRSEPSGIKLRGSPMVLARL